MALSIGIKKKVRGRKRVPTEAVKTLIQETLQQVGLPLGERWTADLVDTEGGQQEPTKFALVGVRGNAVRIRVNPTLRSTAYLFDLSGPYTAEMVLQALEGQEFRLPARRRPRKPPRKGPPRPACKGAAGDDDKRGYFLIGFREAIGDKTESLDAVQARAVACEMVNVDPSNVKGAGRFLGALVQKGYLDKYQSGTKVTYTLTDKALREIGEQPEHVTFELAEVEARLAEIKAHETQVQEEVARAKEALAAAEQALEEGVAERAFLERLLNSTQPPNDTE